MFIGTFALMAFAGRVPAEETVFPKEGKQLYSQHCSRCHGGVDDSAKAGRGMNRLSTAIRTQPQHRPVSELTDEQILLSAMALREGEEQRSRISICSNQHLLRSRAAP